MGAKGKESRGMNRHGLSTKQRKDLLLEALKKTMGMIAPAVAQCNGLVARRTYIDWMKKDPKFRQDVEDLTEARIDFVETQLMKNIQERDTTSILFFLKCKGKHRGWVDRPEVVAQQDDAMNRPARVLTMSEAAALLKKIEEEV